jgi:hypothetical protein
MSAYNFTQESFLVPKLWLGFGIFLGSAAGITRQIRAKKTSLPSSQPSGADKEYKV